MQESPRVPGPSTGRTLCISGQGTDLLPLLSPDGDPGCALGSQGAHSRPGKGLSQVTMEAILEAWD